MIIYILVQNKFDKTDVILVCTTKEIAESLKPENTDLENYEILEKELINGS